MTSSAPAGDGPVRREVRTVAACFVAYGAVFFDRLAPLFLVGAIAADLGVPSRAEGTLALLIGVGWAAAMPVVRATAGRVTDRQRLLLALACGAIAAGASVAATGWLPFVALRGLSGFLVATGSPAVTALAFGATPPHRRGLSMGVVQSSPRLLGSLVSPAVVTAVAVNAGWRAALLTSALVLASAAVVFHLLLPDVEPRAVGAPAAAPFRLRPGGRRELAVCTLAAVLLLTWLTTFSQSAVGLLAAWQDIGVDAAGAQVGLYGLGAGAAALLVPVASDRLGRHGALALATGIGGSGGLVFAVAVAADLVLSPGATTASLVAGGVAMGGLPLAISIIPAETVASGDVGRALLAPIALGEGLGAAALPALAALMAARAGVAEVLAASAAGVLVIAVASLGLRSRQQISLK